MIYIHCPFCDAIRETQPAACPECGQCAGCGEKLPEGVEVCECGFPDDEKLARRINRDYGIPSESVEEEKAKQRRRKKLEPYKIAGRVLLLIFCVALGGLTAIILLADANDLTRALVGLPVVCLLIYGYWICFRGAGYLLNKCFIRKN